MATCLYGVRPPLQPDGGKHWLGRDSHSKFSFECKVQPVGKYRAGAGGGKQQAQRKIPVTGAQSLPAVRHQMATSAAAAARPSLIRTFQVRQAAGVDSSSNATP